MEKRYWRRGLAIGIAFGILVVLAHENASEFFQFLGIDIPDNPYVNGGSTTPTLYWIYVSIVQILYNIGLAPGIFLGIFIVFFQFFLPPLTYGFLGLILGRLYAKLKVK